MPQMEITDELRKEIAPFSHQDLTNSGVSIIDNPDPVLTYLAVGGEEQYRLMERSEPAVLAAKMQRVNTLIAAGSEVLEGPSGSPRALFLKDWTVRFLKRIPNFTTVQAKCLDAIYWGWRPLEILWDFDFQFKRTPYWGIKAIHEKKPEHFKFTSNRDLVFNGDCIGQDPLVFSTPEEKLHWLICTAHSTDNPYGDALYKNIWLLWYTKSRFFKIFAQGMERSTGIVKARQEFSLDPASKKKSINEVAGELEDMLRKLSNHNILIERNGWLLEFISNVDFSTAWEMPLKYCDELIALTIVGQTLTMRVGSSGSRSAAQVHRQGLTDFAKADAKQLEGWINDGLLKKAFDLNFGEISEEDRPKWRTHISNPISIENSQAMYDMGAPIDGLRLAQACGVPLVMDEKPGSLILQLNSSPNEEQSEEDPMEPEDQEDTQDDEREDTDEEFDDRPRMLGESTTSVVKG